MKKQIIILCGAVVVVVLVLSYRYFYPLGFAPAVSVTPAPSYGFVGVVISMKSNVLVVNGLYDTGNTQNSKGIAVSQNVTVVMSPNTKIFKKEPPDTKIPATMEDLYRAVKKGSILFRLSADHDFSGTNTIMPIEVIYAATGYKGSL